MLGRSLRLRYCASCSRLATVSRIRTASRCHGRAAQTNERPTRIARALEELGRIIKTLHLLNYINNETYRRRILTQLNRGEGHHQLARIVFHGKRGELRQRYREGQECDSTLNWDPMRLCSNQLI